MPDPVSDKSGIVSDFVVRAACDAYESATSGEFRPHAHLMREALEVAVDLLNVTTYAQDAVRYKAALERVRAMLDRPWEEIEGDDVVWTIDCALNPELTRG